MKKIGAYIAGLIGLGILLVNSGCESDKATIPSFIRIDTIIVDSTDYDSTGSIASKINLAWVYLDENLQGVYTLPAKFPVIGEGPKKIMVGAGVYEFGNGSTATRYIFYDPWIKIDTLVVEDTLVLTPHVRYNKSLLVQYKEDFNSPFTQSLIKDADESSVGSSYIHSYNVTPFEGGASGYLYLPQGESTDKLVVKSNVITVPKNKTGYFLELNYKCNTIFTISIETSQAVRGLVGFNKKDTWNKAYLNITNAIDITPGTDVSVVFTVPQDTTIVDQEVFIDNLKLIYK